MPDTTIIAAVLTWVENHPDLVDGEGVHLPVALEQLPAEGVDAVMLSALTGEPYIRRYKTGGHLASLPFAVYLRVNGGDTASRIDAMRVLGDMAESIEDRSTWPVAPSGYDSFSLALRTMPAPIATDSGTQDYQVTFELTYRKRG